MNGRLLAMLFAGLLLAGCGGQSAAIVVAPTAVASVAPAASSLQRTPVEVVVYVVGAVARPGVYSLPPDSRVQDAISAAGGLSAGADQVRINLAARVHDEQENFVPQMGEALPALVGGNGLDLNAASAAQLRQTLGVTSTLANKIVAYRRQHGPFASVDDLRKVPVSDADVERIRGLI